MSKARDGRTGARERQYQKSYIRLMSLFVDSLNSLTHSSVIFSSRLAFWMIVNHLSFPSALIFALSAARAHLQLGRTARQGWNWSIFTQPRVYRDSLADVYPSYQVEVAMTNAYCVKEKKNREMNSPRTVTMKNGRKAHTGTCSSCGTKLFRITGK